MRIRPTVGVLVLDEAGRVLLIEVEDTVAIDRARPELTRWWGPPGGGVEGAETFEEAGVREVWEETGLRIAELSPWLATYERTIIFPDEAVLFHIRYFAARAHAAELDHSNQREDERSIFRSARWWTLEEIEQSGAAFLPPGLPDLLRAVLRGELPPQPIVLQ